MGKKRLKLRANETFNKNKKLLKNESSSGNNSIDLKESKFAGDDSEQSENEDEILMDRDIKDENIPITFEFNDMNEIYNAGVMLLLRDVVSRDNGGHLASVIVNQGMYRFFNNGFYYLLL